MIQIMGNVLDFKTILILPDGKYAICHEPMVDDVPLLDLSKHYSDGEWFCYNGSYYYVVGEDNVKDFR